MTAISQLLQASQQLHPSLSETIEGDELNHESVARLISQLQEDFPKAGKAYWGNRCWALMYWQAIYMSVIAVHSTPRIFYLTSFEVKVRESSIYGFSPLSENMLPLLTHYSVPQRINIQTEQLISHLEKSLSLLTQHTRINLTNAWRLTLDCVFIVLQKLTGINDNDKCLFSQHWHHAFSQTPYFRKHSLGYFDVNPSKLFISAQSNNIVFKRTSCCMHYLHDRNDICSTCPKNKQTKMELVT